METIHFILYFFVSPIQTASEKTHFQNVGEVDVPGYRRSARRGSPRNHQTFQVPKMEESSPI